jgi:four helix bundle protein
MACSGIPYRPGANDLVNQCIRAAASIGANLAEARGCGTRKEFTKFFRIALKSANETHYWLELMCDVGYGPQGTLKDLIDEVQQLEKMVAAAVLKLQSKK